MTSDDSEKESLVSQTAETVHKARPFRVLSLDGGGMRGIYAATYLSCLSEGFAKLRRVQPLDIGAGFDLIVGTSTGGIIACALAAGVSLTKVISLYQERGSEIFPMKLPTGIFGALWQNFKRPKALAAGQQALYDALYTELGDMTIGELYAQRGIALAITTVEMSHHRSWVFKTPHNPGTNHRDDGYRLIDVCLATSAAPIFRSLAAIDNPGDAHDGYFVFADGGLWANNPVLVGLLDALQLVGEDQTIEIFCLGTCPLPAGEQIQKNAIHRGIKEWKFGGAVASLSIDAQEFAFDNIARLLAPHLKKTCNILRFPQERVPATLIPFLGMDDTRPEATNALMKQARIDANMTNSACNDPNNRIGQFVSRLFMDMPELPNI